MEKPTAYAAYAGPLTTWEDQELFDAAEAVRSLTDHPGWKVVFRLLSEKKQREIDRLVHGPVVDQATYAAVTSHVSGIDSSLRAVDAVLYAAETREQVEQRAAEVAERTG